MLNVRYLSICRFGLNRKGLVPGGEPSVLGNDNLISVGSRAVIDDRGLTFLGHKPCATVHPVTGERRLQFCRLPSPVDHVGAGDMDERKPFP